MQSLRPYIEGQRFLVRSDHAALKWLISLKDPTRRLARWCYRLSTFDYEIIHRPGRKHQVPDALSRLLRPDNQSEDHPQPVADELPPFDDTSFAVTRNKSKKMKKKVAPQIEEPPEAAHPTLHSENGTHELGDIPTPVDKELDRQDAEDLDMELDALDVVMMRTLGISEDADAEEIEATGIPKDLMPPKEGLMQPITQAELLESQQTDADCQELSRRLTSEPSFFEGSDGLLRRKHPSIPNVKQIVLPQALRKRLCHMAHYAIIAGHPGQTRMKHTIQQTYYWPQMAADVMATVRSCPHCAKNRIRLVKNSNQMKLFPATRPLESISMDLLGPLQKSRAGNRFILVMTDRFTKLTQVVSLRRITAAVIAAAVCQHCVRNSVRCEGRKNSTCCVVATMDRSSAVRICK